jgi:hypothetical protein
VLSQLTGQKQTDSCLDFPASDGRTLVVVGKTRGLSSDAFENVIDEIVHDRHGFRGDASVGVDLLQRFIVGILIAVFFLSSGRCENIYNQCTPMKFFIYF